MLDLTCKSAMVRAHFCRNLLPSTRILSAKRPPWDSCNPHISVHGRQFSQSISAAYPEKDSKDSQDRNSINRESTEYTRSGTDNEMAGVDDVAFNSDLTDPDTQKKKTGEGDVSIVFVSLHIEHVYTPLPP